MECFKPRTDVIGFMPEKQPFLAAGQGAARRQGEPSAILGGGLDGAVMTGGYGDGQRCVDWKALGR